MGCKDPDGSGAKCLCPRYLPVGSRQFARLLPWSFHPGKWEAIDDTSACGTLTDGVTTVSLVFGFNPEGTIAIISAAARYRDKLTAMPWAGRFSGSTVCDGMLIPLAAEVGWVHPEGIRLYFKGTITKISYEFAL